jgi:hypothetical protein
MEAIRKRYAEACDVKFYADEKAESATLAVEEAIESGASAAEIAPLEEEAQKALDALGPLQDKCDKLSIALKGFVRLVHERPERNIDGNNW